MQLLQYTIYDNFLFKECFPMDAELFRKKVLGAWLGKAVGGTLGQPWEGSGGPLSLSYYDPVPTTMMPNDDLDLQILWACKLAVEWNGEISRKNFGKAWLNCVGFPFDEYGVAIRNLKMGISAPQTGSYDNWFTDGLGAAIRSEIWACFAPGNPKLAAEYAFEDACVDHAGNGIYAEQFLAAMESQAFVEDDLEKLIQTGLSFIPAGSELAEAIRDTIEWCGENPDFLTVRSRIMEKYGNANFTDVKMNLSFMTAALLLGKGDFGKTVCMAVNFGQDTDCTGATVGAIMGIMNPDSVSAHWLAPIGRTLVVSPEITGITPPPTLDEFTDLVIALKEKVYLSVPADVPADLSGFGIPFRRSVFSPWFAADFRKFKPEMREPAEKITVPGNLFELDFAELPHDSLLMMETDFTLQDAGKVRLLVNSPANMRVWVDGEFRFGREYGRMVPAFHRALLNQMCDLELSAGAHTLTMGFAPACGKMKKAEVLFGLANTGNHWLTGAFRK